MPDTDTDSIKMQIKRMVAEGRADAAWEYAETIRDQLTEDQHKELELWIGQNSYDAFRTYEKAEVGRNKWLLISTLVKDGETLKDALPRLPVELQEFLKNEAKRAATIGKSLH